jgi:aryl-alcohol dehydrogenase-like predicted oxidoreductase
VVDLGHTALGAWSGGRFIRYGEPVDDDRLTRLLRPDPRIRTVITADVYGEGAADGAVGRAVAGLPRDGYRLVGMVGHDFTTGARAGARGFPRFTDPALRGESDYAGYLRAAAEASLERIGVARFDLLLLHNPDRTGYSSPRVWEGMAAIRDAGLADALGVAPGPANGFTLDLISCVERFGAVIDWAMLILNPFEPWPGSLALPACQSAGVRVVARVVDYGGVFHDDVPDEDGLAAGDHRSFRPQGWVGTARRKLDAIRPIAERHGLTPLQLACQWTLAQPAVACVVPTLIQEPGPGAKPIEQQREELAGLPANRLLDEDELARIAAVGDNAGCMRLKGGSPVHTGGPLPDAWPLADDLVEAAGRWGIVPERDLVMRS